MKNKAYWVVSLYHSNKRLEDWFKYKFPNGASKEPIIEKLNSYGLNEGSILAYKASSKVKTCAQILNNGPSYCIGSDINWFLL